MEMNGFVGKDGLLYCKVCGERIERWIDFPLLDGNGKTERRKVPIPCRCRREEKAEIENRLKFQEDQIRINELRKLSLMDAILKDVRFSSFEIIDDNRKIFNIAKNYVEHFDIMLKNRQGILFWGNVGTGKSYTAAAIANELLDRQHSVIMTSFIKLLKDTKKADNDDFVSKLNKAELLIIDDLGAERGTDYALEIVYDIIDSRYRSGKPIILTTNLTWQEMKSCSDVRYNRIYDRIFEMCYPVKVDGPSWRKKEAVDRFAYMKKILEG